MINYLYFFIIIFILIIIIFYFKNKNYKNSKYFMKKYIKENLTDTFLDYYINKKNKRSIDDTITNIYSNKVNKFKDNNININNLNSLKKCQVPTLNSEQCYKSKEFECPIVNGTYLQCTNNYIPKPEKYNADCSNRTFDMVPYPWKISENCYYDSINFDREKKYNKVKFI